MKLQMKLALFIVFACSIIIKAQDFNDALRLSEPGFLSSPRALGMGNAYTALSNDFSASLFNPAGYAFVKKTEFSGSVDYNSFKNNTSFFNNQTNYSNSMTNLNQAGFVFPFPTYQGSFVLAFGFNQIKKFDGAVKFSGFNPSNNSMIQDINQDTYYDDNGFAWNIPYELYLTDSNFVTPIDGGLKQSGNIVNDGRLNSWTFSGAVEFQKDFYLGISISRINGDFRRDREYWEDDVNNNYPSSLQLDPGNPQTADFQSFYFNDIIRWDISSWDFTFGLIAKLDDNLKFGFTLKLPKYYTIRETYFVDAHSDFGTGKRFYLDPPIEDKVEYKISTPTEFSAGVAYSKDNVTFSFDAKMIDYTQMQFQSGLDQGSISGNNKDIKDLFTTVLNLNTGIEYILPKIGLALRAGFMWLPSPYKADPSEYDKKVATVGLGFETNKNIAFNIGYAYGWWKNFGDNYGSNLSRTYQDITHSNLIMGIKYFL